MIFILTYLCPPLAVLLMGKPVSAILNFFLTCLFWYPGVRHAQYLLYNKNEDKRNKRLVKAVDRPAWVNDVIQRPKEQRMIIPVIREKQLPKPQSPDIIDSPDTGMYGTRFRKRDGG